MTGHRLSVFATSLRLSFVLHGSGVLDMFEKNCNLELLRAGELLIIKTDLIVGWSKYNVSC